MDASGAALHRRRRVRALAPEDRPALTQALAVIDSGRAGTLVVSKMDRLSRTILSAVVLMARAKEEG